MTQWWSHRETGSMDNPWVPLYCCFTAIWGIVFTAGWKRLEMAYQHEWDTKSFEATETLRREFIQNPHTRQSHCSYKDEIERYPDPNWRSIALAVSATVVCAFIALVIGVVSGIAYFKFKLMESFEPHGLAPVAKGIGGVMQALSIMVFNRIYQVVLQALTSFENWRTETEYEDATIAKDFCFKFVNAYFACFFVAFVQNNIMVFGEDMHCPEWHCMPELTNTLAAVFAVQMTVVQFLEVCLPP
jgi:ABC-type Fe3+ transport system permease subunit